jgi:endogenous inhibitor of DNA gyrase (YacG/DUF329 family)
MFTIKCFYCGNEFQNKQPNARFCSTLCRETFKGMSSSGGKAFPGAKSRTSMAGQIVKGGDRW